MIEDTLKQIIENEGATFYDTQIANENGSNIYRVFITHKDGVSLDLCAKISNIISPILDTEPPIKGQYFLEVSSPGLERKLSKPSHFINSLEEFVRVELHSADKIEGKMIKASEESFTLEEADGEKVKIKYEDILKAKTFVQW